MTMRAEAVEGGKEQAASLKNGQTDLRFFHLDTPVSAQ